MSISIKNDAQIAYMREANQIVAKAHELLAKEVRAGVTTKELDGLAEEFILSQGATPSFKGYNGYPASICVSVNEEVIHGIPGLRKLEDGDIVSIDIGAYKNGYHGDAARTHAVGQVSEEDQRLIEVTRQSFFEGIALAKAGGHLHQIGAAIEDYVAGFGYTCVRDYIGHGIGRDMHEAPEIPNYHMPSRGPRLYAGMTLAIEPMVNAGGWEITLLRDNWTVVTKDGKKSAHYENTILVTDGAPEILSL